MNSHKKKISYKKEEKQLVVMKTIEKKNNYLYFIFNTLGLFFLSVYFNR
jgi:hypothetical protein